MAKPELTAAELIETHKMAIADLETIQVIIKAIKNLATDTNSDLFEWDIEGDDFVPHLINPRTQSIVDDAVEAVEEFFLLAHADEDRLAEAQQKGDLLFVAPKEA